MFKSDLFLIIVKNIEDFNAKKILGNYQENIKVRNGKEYKLDNDTYKVITSNWLDRNPFNSWSCGLIYTQVVFLTSDVKEQDVRYIMSRVRSCTPPNDYLAIPNAKLQFLSNNGLEVRFKSGSLRFPNHKDMDSFQRDELWRVVVDIAFSE